MTTPTPRGKDSTKVKQLLAVQGQALDTVEQAVLVVQAALAEAHKLEQLLEQQVEALQALVTAPTTTVPTPPVDTPPVDTPPVEQVEPQP